MQLVVAVKGSRSVLKWVLGAMIPTKALATIYFKQDGMQGIAAWEALSGIIYAAIVLFT